MTMAIRAAPSEPPKRVRWRGTSWFDSAHVGHTWRAPRMATVLAMRSRNGAAANGDHRKRKLKLRCSSSSSP